MKRETRENDDEERKPLLSATSALDVNFYTLTNTHTHIRDGAKDEHNSLPGCTAPMMEIFLSHPYYLLRLLLLLFFSIATTNQRTNERTKKKTTTTKRTNDVLYHSSTFHIRRQAAGG